MVLCFSFSNSFMFHSFFTFCDQTSVLPFLLFCDTAAAQNITNLVGVIFDRDALGYTVVDETSAVTPMNAKGLYWNNFYHFTDRWYNDFTEKGIVLLLD